MKRLLLALLLHLLVAPGCTRTEVVRYCEACIEKDGGVYCGKAYANLAETPDTTEEETKLAAAREGCVEWAARKGGGYVGPVFKEFRAACAKEVKPSDLRRVRCEDMVTKRRWHPRDGSDAL